MLELARQQEFVDPDPDQVVRLDQAGEDQFATAVAPTSSAK
jgi:hypothetical protein